MYVQNIQWLIVTIEKIRLAKNNNNYYYIITSDLFYIKLSRVKVCQEHSTKVLSHAGLHLEYIPHWLMVMTAPTGSHTGGYLLAPPTAKLLLRKKEFEWLKIMKSNL